jgi:membrane associated rhomboid family serine protease
MIASATSSLKPPSFGTALTMGICVVVYLFQLLGFLSAQSFCVGAVVPLPSSADAVLSLLMVDSHRTFTSNFLHGSPTHILFNMLTLYGLGDEFERRVGSTRFLHWLSVLATLGGVIDMLLCTVLYSVPWLPFFRACSIGLSGFLFSMMIDQTSRMDAARSVPLFCGTFNVPVRFYPWALLLLLALFPGVSFVGHLAGILVGYLFARGYLSWFEINDAAVDKLDSLLRNRVRNFVVVNGALPR